ncbi:hypothetical protein K8R33_03035 [archaeon]|nr:hypothetical protein [archaeon]
MVKIIIDKKTKNLEGGFVIDIIYKLKINVDDYLIVRDGKLITEDAKVDKKDKLEFISIVSSG